MGLFISAASRAVRSIFAPGMFSIFIISFIVTIITLIGFVIGTSFLFGWLAGYVQTPALAHLLPWIGTVGATLFAWFLFPGITPIIINFFDERIAHIIEREDYPANPATRKPELIKELLHDVRFSLWAILLNILVLPLYLLPLVNVCLFYVLNGYLLGREYFTMVALRHMPLEEAKRLRLQYRRIITMAGIALAILATVPIANLFAPFWGVAMMVHLYHKLTGTPKSELLPPV